MVYFYGVLASSDGTNKSLLGEFNW